MIDLPRRVGERPPSGAVYDRLLVGLPGVEIQHLSGLGRRRTVSPGVHLCFEGDPSGDVFLIEHGLVRIVMSPPSGRELILSTRTDGQLVGEMAVFDGRPRSASVIASEQTTVVVIPGDVFRTAVERRPTLSAYFLRELSERLRAADVRTMESFSDDLATRVAARLVGLAEAVIEHELGPREISVAVRQSDLAGWVGSSREAVARVLGDFRRNGLVRTGRGSIDILDIHTLRTHARS